jgi:hypothetical protein
MNGVPKKTVFSVAALVVVLVLAGCTDGDVRTASGDEDESKKPPPYLPVESVIMDRNVYRHNSSWGLDDTVTLRAHIVPANATVKTLMWESSDESVAKIEDVPDDGKTAVITFIKEGAVTISAVSIDDEDKRADCAVTVEKWEPELAMYFTGKALLEDYSEIDIEPTTTAMPNPVWTTVGSRNNRLVINADQNGAEYGIPWKDNPDGSPGENECFNRNNTYVYLDVPIVQPFTVSARVRIAKIGPTTLAIKPYSERNGVFMGAISDPRLNNAREVQFCGARVALNCEDTSNNGGRRLYTSQDDGSMGGTRMSTSGSVTTHWSLEYVYKVDRNPNGSYTGEILNSSGQVFGNYTANRSAAQVGLDLRPGRPVYAGFIISGVMAEISQVKVQLNDGTVIYESPDANPE